MNGMFRTFATASLAIALITALACSSVTPAEAGPKGGNHGHLSGTDLGSGR